MCKTTPATEKGKEKIRKRVKQIKINNIQDEKWPCEQRRLVIGVEVKKKKQNYSFIYYFDLFFYQQQRKTNVQSNSK